MKVVIFAGGFGSRISELSHLKPKPMIEVGGKPIVYHIMHSYAKYGFKHFVLCLGFKSEFIKDFFINRHYLINDFSVDSSRNQTHLLSSNNVDDWQIDLVDTGLDCMTGARIARAYDKYYVKSELFGVTYGDGLCDLNLEKAIDFHKSGKTIGTITGVNPVSRFGQLKTRGNLVNNFLEKPILKDQWINGGYFFFTSQFREYLSTEPNCILEHDPLKKLTEQKELRIFKHRGFWKCMDTQRDKEDLESLYENGQLNWLK